MTKRIARQLAKEGDHITFRALQQNEDHGAPSRKSDPIQGRGLLRGNASISGGLKPKASRILTMSDFMPLAFRPCPLSQKSSKVDRTSSFLGTKRKCLNLQRRELLAARVARTVVPWPPRIHYYLPILFEAEPRRKAKRVMWISNPSPYALSITLET
ncbi:hypothetical protein BX600DRAFT_463825 [Xylariales sp. PMI_506]|nr:hypothetical protein BX600DRAFT_463825 [Xylariales sp. PMI_506]